MTKQYYECHITLEGDPALLKHAVENLKWKFSKIDGDPVMGAGVKCYATRHYNVRWPERDVLSFLHTTAAELALNFTVTRKKIELVIYDDRSSKVRCDGGCPECHLDDLTASPTS